VTYKTYITAATQQNTTFMAYKLNHAIVKKFKNDPNFIQWYLNTAEPPTSTIHNWFID